MNRRHLLMVAGAAVLVVFAWFSLLWSPKGADLAAAKERRTSAQTQVQQLQARLDGLKAAQKDADRLTATADRLGAAVPATTDLATFLLAANDAAAQAGVDYLSITPTPPVAAPGGPSVVTVSLTIKGRYGQVLGFLDRLVDLPRVVVLDSVNVSAEQGSGGSPPLSVSLTGRIFTAEAPATPTAAGTTPTTTAAAAPAGTTPAPAPAGTTNEMVP